MAINFDTVTNFFLSSSLGKLSSNFQKTRDEFAKVLYRDGTNVMQGDLDMDGRRVINAGFPVDDNDLVTLAQVKTITRGDKGDPGGNVLSVGLWSQINGITVPLGTDLIQTSGYDSVGTGGALYALDSDQTSTVASRFRRVTANGRWFKIAEDAIGWTMAGARGVVGYDDTASVQALYDYLAAQGGGTAFIEPKTFRVTTLSLGNASRIRTYGLGDKSTVFCTNASSRANVFNADGLGDSTRSSGLSFESFRIVGGSAWSGGPYSFNGVLTGNGIRTRYVDDVRVVNCTLQNLSDSGVSIRDGDRAFIQGNIFSELAQGSDIFYRCRGARVIGNTYKNIRVFVGVNVEGSVANGHPENVIVSSNTIDGAVTSGIDIIEAEKTTVSGNAISGISGNHPDYPGYYFGIHASGSPKTLFVGNTIQNVTGIGVRVGAGSSDTSVVGNTAFACSVAPFRLDDGAGTATSTEVLLAENAFAGDAQFSGNVSTRARYVESVLPQFILRAYSTTKRNAQFIIESVLGGRWRIGTDISTNDGTNQLEFYLDDYGTVLKFAPGGWIKPNLREATNDSDAASKSPPVPLDTLYVTPEGVVRMRRV